jgi:hypothetical protein
LYTVGNKGLHFCFVVALQLLNGFPKIWCDPERTEKDEENELNLSVSAQAV